MATYSSWIENIVLWRNFLRNHLRPFLRFYGAYFFSESANSILKILTDCSFLRNDFENQFLRNYSIATTKNFFTILHSQFNYHTLPVTPFNSDYFYIFSCSRNAQVTFKEKSQLKKLLRVPLWIEHYNLWIVGHLKLRLQFL